MKFEAFDLFEEMMTRLVEQFRRADSKEGRQNYCIVRHELDTGDGPTLASWS